MLDFCSNANHKGSRLSKVLLEKSLKFVLSKKDGIVIFNLGLILLLVKVDSILEKQGCKKNALRAHVIGYVKIVLALLTKVVVLNIKGTIAQVGILGLESPIPECKVWFDVFLVFNK